MLYGRLDLQKKTEKEPATHGDPAARPQIGSDTYIIHVSPAYFKI